MNPKGGSDSGSGPAASALLVCAACWIWLPPIPPKENK